MWLKIVRQELQNKESYSESFEVLAWFIFEKSVATTVNQFFITFLYTHSHTYTLTHTHADTTNHITMLACVCG